MTESGGKQDTPLGSFMFSMTIPFNEPTYGFVANLRADFTLLPSEMGGKYWLVYGDWR